MSGRCYSTTAEHKRTPPLVTPYPWTSLCWVKARKGQRSAKARARKGKAKATKDEKDKGAKGNRKGEDNAKATEYFARYCLLCEAWGHMKKDCWQNENNKSGEATASLETPITPGASTTTEPPTARMLIQSDDNEAVPADPTQQCLYSVTKHGSIHNDFLFDFGAATSVRQQSLADSMGGKPSGPGVELRSATRHQFTTTGNTTICLRTRDGTNVAGDTPDCAQEDWSSDVCHITLAMCAILATSSHSAVVVERYSENSLANESSLHELAECIG